MKVNLNELDQMDKYKENLLVSNTNIYSYLTDVATIYHNKKEIIVIIYNHVYIDNNI